MSALFGDTQTIGTDKILVTSITYYRLTCEFDRANSLLNSQNKNYLQFIILIVVTCFPSLQSCFAQTLGDTFPVGRILIRGLHHKRLHGEFGIDS